MALASIVKGESTTLHDVPRVARGSLSLMEDGRMMGSKSKSSSSSSTNVSIREEWLPRGPGSHDANVSNREEWLPREPGSHDAARNSSSQGESVHAGTTGPTPEASDGDCRERLSDRDISNGVRGHLTGGEGAARVHCMTSVWRFIKCSRVASLPPPCFAQLTYEGYIALYI